jgi:hypothetical protein
MAATSAGARWPWPGKKIAASMKMELVRRRRVQEDWRRNGGEGRSDWVHDPIPLFKGGFSEEHITAIGVMPRFMDQRTSFP